MQRLWVGMTDSRELQNADLKKIISIRDDITFILEEFSQLRHNGISVFSVKVGVNQGQMEGNNTPGVNEGGQSMQGSMYSGNSRGVYIDFVPAYSSLRQNLVFVRENVKSYNAKKSVTQRFINCKINCNKLSSQCEEYRSKFTDVGNQLHYAKKRSIAERNEKISNRQNELSVEAVVGILDGGQ